MKTIEDILGFPGKMIAGSKGRFRHNNPTAFAVFNSNLVTQTGKKVWHGDLNLSDKKTISDLKTCSNVVGETLYVLYEMDARFENESNPKIEEYALKIALNGKIEINPKSNFVYIHKSGIPKLYSKSEYKKRNPVKKEKRVKQKYDENKYEPFKLPTNNALKGTKGASPIDKLQRYLIKKFGKHTAQKLWLAMYWTKSYDREFSSLLKDFMINVLKITDKYEIQKAISWSKLETPMIFIDTPKWVRLGYAYIDKDKMLDDEIADANENYVDQ